jgi:hypothetical protein
MKKRKRAFKMSEESEKPTLSRAKKLKMSESRAVKVPVPIVREPAITSATTTTSLARTEEVVPAPATTATPALAKDVTPAPAPLSESVFKSGIRSVRRLLFGGHIDAEEAET